MSDPEPEVMQILQRMQQQLTFLEKKLDTLIQQSQQKGFDRGPRNFSRPFRPFGRPNRPDQGPGRGPGPGFGHGGHGGPSGPGHFQKKKPFFGRKRDH